MTSKKAEYLCTIFRVLKFEKEGTINPFVRKYTYKIPNPLRLLYVNIRIQTGIEMEYNGKLYGFSAVKVKLVDSLI